MEEEAAPMLKKLWFEEGCNKINVLEGRSEIASAAALFYLEKGESLYPTRRFPDI